MIIHFSFRWHPLWDKRCWQTLTWTESFPASCVEHWLVTRRHSRDGRLDTCWWLYEWWTPWCWCEGWCGRIRTTHQSCANLNKILKNILRTFWEHFQNILRTFWEHSDDVIVVTTLYFTRLVTRSRGLTSCWVGLGWDVVLCVCFFFNFLLRVIYYFFYDQFPCKDWKMQFLLLLLFLRLFTRQLGCLALSFRFYQNIKQLLNNCPAR